MIQYCRELVLSLICLAPFVIHTDQVSVLKIEAVELIACLFGVVDVFVDNKCSALGVIGNALADLAGKSQTGQNYDDDDDDDKWQTYRIGPNLPKRSNNWSAVTL